MSDAPAALPGAIPVGAEVTYSRQGARVGAVRALPVALSVFAYGLVFGVLSGQAGLSLAEAVLMSVVVYAGSAQFIALGLWTQPLPVLALVVTTLVVNLRHVMMGMALSPWFARLSPRAAYGTVFFMSDESWALTMGEYAKGQRDAAFLLGSGLAVWSAWVAATVAGRLLGGLVHDPARLGLDFAFTAVFLSLLVGLWKGKSDLPPWLVSAGVALAAFHWLPGKWYILLGALAGTAIGVAHRAR